MGERQFAVRISPGRWSGDLQELASRLANVTGMSAGPIEQALNRGPMTVDADLRRDEAEQLMRRLSRASIPSDVVREGAAEEVVERGEPMERGGAAGLDDQSKGDEKSSGAHGEEGARDQSSGAGARLQWELDEPSSTEDADDGIGGESDEAAPEASEPPSLTSLVEDSGEPDGGGEVDAGEHREPRPMTEGLEGSGADSSGDDGAASSGPPNDSDDKSDKKRDGPPAFDGGQLEEALTGARDDERPYEPEGYDDRPPHMPALAALLSLIAPGAGQAYNGDPNRGARIAFRALLVYPWVRAVRDAWNEAVEIREYREPYPPEGHVGKALGHVAAVWAVAAAVVAAGWIGVETWRASDFRQEETSRVQQVSEAVDEAKFQVRTAKVRTWEALDRAGPGQKDFTMEAPERAERLFRIGLEHCRARDYDMCEATMRRVISLDEQLRGRAIKLQVWANAQKNTGKEKPFPDIGVDETLRQYDRRQLNPDAGEAD